MSAMPTGHDTQCVSETKRCISRVTWTPSNRVRQVGSVILQNCISPPMTRISAHTIMLIQLPLFESPHDHAPTSRRQEWRWPNKPRPHIMRSDSPAAEEEVWAFPLSALLGISAVQQVTQSFECLMAAECGSWKRVKFKDGLVGPARWVFCPGVLGILELMVLIQVRFRLLSRNYRG